MPERLTNPIVGLIPTMPQVLGPYVQRAPARAGRQRVAVRDGGAHVVVPARRRRTAEDAVAGVGGVEKDPALPLYDPGSTRQAWGHEP